MTVTRIRNGFPGISRVLVSSKMTIAANSLLLLAVILVLGAHDQVSVLVSAYSPQPGVSIAVHPPVYRSSRRMPSTDFSAFPQYQMSSSTRKRKLGYEQQEPGHSTSTTLYHMGHSHSHHDHHSTSTSTSNKPKVLSKQRILRRLALVLFCWMATCGTKLIKTATNVNGASRFVGLSKSDWISFALTTVALTSANKITGAVQQSVENFRKFVEGIRKHSSTTEVQEEFQHHQHTQALAADKADADRVTWIGVAVNLLLSVGKLGVGITAHSSVLVADAGHSLSDLVSDFITLWSVNVARLPPDEDHPYGHYKFEAIGSLFLSLTLLATGGSVGLMANKQLMEVLQTSSSVAAVPVQLPGSLALVMAGLSILSKEWLFRITKQVGERLRSPVVIANAWHHRSDAYSSVLALFSIGWAMIGFPAADAGAGILVAGMICMTGGEILVESVKQLSDSADSDLQAEIVEILNELDDDDVIAITSVRARQIGSAASIDVSVEIPSVLSTTASTAVEERIRQRLVGELSIRRGGSRNDASSSGIIATVHAKPYLEISPLMEEIHQSEYVYDESMFAKLAFEKFDTDVDGKLTIDELKAGLEKTLNIQLSYDRVKRLIEEFDVNNDGFLELEEMVTIDKFRSKIEALSREEMELAIQPNPLDDMPSTTYIEQQVRNQAQLMYPKIRSVEGVTVHYTSRNSVTVDVNIRITEESGSNALGKVRKYARELKGNLETELQEIESARVYLDLNTNDDGDDEILLSRSTLNMTTVAP